MRRKTLVLLCFVLSSNLFAQTFENIAHRGGAGLLPENSIPAFLNALDSNATVLELDVVITKDNQVIVSHEPYISSDYCLYANGDEISKSNEKNLNIYEMNFEEVQKFDCGSKGKNDKEPLQRVPTNKPLLSEVIKEVERHVKNFTQYEVDYLIEIKSTEKGDDINHPEPGQFSDLVYEVIDAYLPLSRVVIQSFDFRVLKYWHETYPEVRLSALVASIRSDDAVLKSLGFVPYGYSPYFKLIRRRTIRNLHKKGIKVIPWTINDEKDMDKMMNWGVDGIITDYPDLLNKLILMDEAN